MVAPIGAGELQGQLVLCIEATPSGVVSDEQRGSAGADDELVARVVSAAREYRALHRGENIALERAAMPQSNRFIPGIVGELRGALRVLDLLRAFDRA